MEDQEVDEFHKLGKKVIRPYQHMRAPTQLATKSPRPVVENRRDAQWNESQPLFTGWLSLVVRSESTDGRHRSMVVAVIAVRMVKMSVNEIVDVVAMRHRLVSAAWTVNVLGIVSPASMSGRAPGRIGVADFQRVLFDLAIRPHVMQVAVVQVVHMVAVLNAGVLAVGAMLMVVIGVQIAHVKGSLLGFGLDLRVHDLHRVHDPVGHQA